MVNTSLKFTTVLMSPGSTSHADRSATLPAGARTRDSHRRYCPKLTSFVHDHDGILTRYMLSVEGLTRENCFRRPCFEFQILDLHMKHKVYVPVILADPTGSRVGCVPDAPFSYTRWFARRGTRLATFWQPWSPQDQRTRGQNHQGQRQNAPLRSGGNAILDRIRLTVT